MIARLQRMILAAQLLLAIGVAAWLIVAHGLHPLIAAPLGLLAPIAVHSGILAAHFTLAYLNRGPWPDTAPRGALPWLKAWALEVVDSVRTFSIAQPLFAFRQYPQPQRPTGIPVLMLHGYFCNHALWLPLAERLAAAGHPLAGVDLEPLFCELDEHGPVIAAAVERLRAATGQMQVALLCHSMGGLAARAYLRRYGDDAIAQVITLGTPHRGTVHAKYGMGLCARQMRPDSEWLRELAAGETPARRRKFTIVMTWHDNIVAPHAIQVLDGARQIRFFSGIAHLTLAYDRRVQDLVIDALAADNPVTGERTDG